MRTVKMKTKVWATNVAGDCAKQRGLPPRKALENRAEDAWSVTARHAATPTMCSVLATFPCQESSCRHRHRVQVATMLVFYTIVIQPNLLHAYET